MAKMEKIANKKVNHSLSLLDFRLADGDLNLYLSAIDAISDTNEDSFNVVVPQI